MAKDAPIYKGSGEASEMKAWAEKALDTKFTSI